MLTLTERERAAYIARPLTPDQRKAISQLMASRRRAWANDGRRTLQFPPFRPGETTTADYIAQFERLRADKPPLACFRPVRFTHADRLAPFLTGPEVTVEVDDIS